MGNCIPTRDHEVVTETQTKTSTMKKSDTSKVIKILLLGTGESGKTTFFKQLKFLKSTGCSTSDIEDFTVAVRVNILVAMKAMLEASNTLEISIKDESNQKIAQDLLAQLETTEDIQNLANRFDPQLAKKLLNLWEDKDLQSIYEMRSKYQLSDSTPYFYQNLERIGEGNYQASNDDIIRCRIKTQGISQVKVTYPEIEFHVYDVGGQRNERKKWIRCFEGVNAVVFVVALSEYDLYCYEDNETKRLDESLSIFQNICDNPVFDEVPMTIYFNKNDIFKEKVQKVDLNVYDKDYTGGCDYDNAFEHIKGLFLKLNKNPNRTVDIFVCTSTETKEFAEKFDEIKDSIFNHFVSKK